MREVFSKFLVDLAKKDERFILLTGDHGYALFDELRRACPDQYLNCGVAEQNMVGVAAGLARGGYRPFVYGLAAFIPTRVVEQIKLDIAHDGLPVVLFGDGAGFVYSTLGTSHQCAEDIACSRAIAGLDVYSPCDDVEMAWALERAYAGQRPSYIRIGKADVGAVHAQPMGPDAAGLCPLAGASNQPLALVATGSMVALARDLAAEVPASIAAYSLPLIKPLPEAALIALAQRHQAVVTLEEHSVFAGMGSAVCEALSEAAPLPIKRVGIADRYSKYCGSYAYLREEHGLTLAQVRQVVQDFSQRQGLALAG